ncbi:MAG: histidine phosphatase family protein [Anaerotignum sp.]|nr:histidine phosphatase family protein [Anaerotignum sp.]
MEQKKTRFYLIRHGETDWNKGGRYQGWTNIELNENGREQARLLGKRFAYLPLDAIYVSPLNRAIATAEPMAKAKGLTPIVDEHFKEINFGEWEGHTIQELSEKYGKVYTDFFDDPFSYPMPGEGSFQNVMKRAVAGFEELEKRHKGENIAIVSHGGLLRVMLVALLGLDNRFYRKTWMTNTSITMLDVMEDGRRLLMTLNDKAHLEMGEFWNTGE